MADQTIKTAFVSRELKCPCGWVAVTTDSQRQGQLDKALAEHRQIKGC